MEPGELSKITPNEVESDILKSSDNCPQKTETSPSVASPTRSSVRKSVSTHVQAFGTRFHRIYGWLGVPMIIIFFLSASWTLTLAVIQAMPNQFANWLMDTETFDNGTFWMLPAPEKHIEIAAIVLLSLFSAGYVGLVVLMLFPDRLIKAKSDPPPVAPGKRSGKLMKSTSISMVNPAIQTWRDQVWYELTSPYGLLRQYYNPVLDLPKLLFQTATLITYLHNGFPVVIISIYTCLLFTNWMISSYRYKQLRPDPHYVLARLFYSFDLFFAVFAPLEVLVYARYTFVFDRGEYRAYIDTLAPGFFERVAKLYADPVQVSRFRIGFHYLQFSSASALFIKSALNLLSLFKWWRTIVHLVENSHHGPRISVARSNECALVINARRRRHVQNSLISAVFFCVGVAVIVHSIVAITTTERVCHGHRQCAVPRHQWNVGAKHCSCIVFVDRTTSVKSFAEWENPPDTTANLAALATTGHLRIIQIINHGLPEFPEELRGCHELEQLILIYAKTVRFPSWAKEFRHLEYLHVEGDFTPTQLVSLPDDLFEDMHDLVFLHLGGLIKLPRVPDLSRLTHLQHLTLAVLHSITEIPSFDKLVNLRTVTLMDTVQVQELPSISNLHHLQSFALGGRQPVCCNGFMTGECDLSAFQCKKRPGESDVTCAATRFSSSDLELATSIPGIVCDPNLSFDLKDTAATVALSDGACGGVMYKKCEVFGMVGICFSSRMSVVSCVILAAYEDMRRLQITRGVGPPCDPMVEAWLGCTK